MANCGAKVNSSIAIEVLCEKNDIISPFRVEGDLRHLQAKAIRRGVPRLLLSLGVF